MAIETVELNAGSGGALIGADLVGGTSYQVVKLDNGADGVAGGPVATGNPLPVVLEAADGVDIGDVDVATLPADVAVAEGGALGLGVLVQGDDGTDRTNVLVDTDGHLQVDVLTSGLPSGASTAANQATANTALAAIQTAVELLDDAVAGSELQVDVVASLPAGTNAIGKLAANSGVDIGDVDVLTLPNVTIGESASVQDANNTTTTPLGISGVFTGTSTETLNYKTITIVIFADQGSAADGVQLQWSPDGTNWNHTAEYTYTANGDFSIGASVRARYFRLVYTNGGTGQGTFRCYTFLHPTEASHNIRPLEYTLTGQESAEMVRAVLSADTGSGYENIAATAGGNLKVSVQEVSDGLDVGAGNVGAETQRITVATDDVNLAAIKTAVEVIDDAVATEGSALGSGVLVQGDDGTDRTNLAVDTDGHPQVDVLGIVPGTGATNLGKASGTGTHAGGDAGVLALAVRRDSDTPLDTNGSYTHLAIDGARGALKCEIFDGGDTHTIDGVEQSGGALGTNRLLGQAVHARTTFPTPVDDADAVPPMADDVGRLVTCPHGVRDLVTQAQLVLTASTAETTLLAAGAAGVFHDLTLLTLTNFSSTACRVDIRDDTGGTVRLSLHLAADGGGAVIPFPVPFKQTAAADNWTAQCSASVTSVYITVQAVKNK